MYNRTNALHELLDVETRRKIERDLVEQPPGRETYQKVWEFYDLESKGISVKTIERYGGYLRTLARNKMISELADQVVGQNIDQENAGLIRGKLFEALVTGETRIGDLLKAALIEKSLGELRIKREEWSAKCAVAQKALAETENDDSPEARQKLRQAVEMIYGLKPVESSQ